MKYLHGKRWALRVAAAVFLCGILLFGYSAWRYAAALPSMPESPPFVATEQPTEIKKTVTSAKSPVTAGIEKNKVTVEKSKQIPLEKINIEDKSKVKKNKEPSPIIEKDPDLYKKAVTHRPPVTLESTLLYPERPKTGDNIGILTIPSIRATLPIIEGTDEEELEKGVGHYKNSVLPGEPDHSILSGHRDTVFRKLGEVELNDLIIVTTSAGQFTYEVVEIYVVDKDDTSVITPTPNATLTLSTCYPFRFIGNAPQRYVIQTILVDYDLKQ